VTIGIPEEFKYTKGIGQGIAISILSYILYKNYNETYNLQLIQKDLKEKLQTMNSQKLNKKEDDNNNNKIENENEIIDMKNNTIASYTLCGFIGILLLYFIYSIFF
jgi:hypothetical protein